MMQFPRESQSYRTGNSIMPRGMLSHFQSLADPVDWAQFFFPSVHGKDKPNHVSLLHPDPAGSPTFPLKEAYSSAAPKDN